MKSQNIGESTAQAQIHIYSPMLQTLVAGETHKVLKQDMIVKNADHPKILRRLVPQKNEI